MAENSAEKIHYTEIELQKCFEIIQGNKKVPFNTLFPPKY
jgi:hypothetical protein